MLLICELKSDKRLLFFGCNWFVIGSVYLIVFLCDCWGLEVRAGEDEQAVMYLPAVYVCNVMMLLFVLFCRPIKWNATSQGTILSINSNMSNLKTDQQPLFSNHATVNVVLEWVHCFKLLSNLLIWNDLYKSIISLYHNILIYNNMGP